MDSFIKVTVDNYFMELLASFDLNDKTSLWHSDLTTPANRTGSLQENTGLFCSRFFLTWKKIPAWLFAKCYLEKCL